MYNRILNKDGTPKNKILINIEEDTTPPIIVKSNKKTKHTTKLNWLITILTYSLNLILSFFKWFWKHPIKLLGAILTAIAIWLLSLFNIKLPNLPFLPIPTQSAKQEEKKQEQKQEDKSKPSEQPTKTITTTNTVNQTNIVTQTNYVNQTVYVTNFVVQPIAVTNTVYKDVPLTVTNILVIKNYSNNNGTNKNNLQNGPAYYLSEDLNTLIQNQTQNPVRGQLVN